MTASRRREAYGPGCRLDRVATQAARSLIPQCAAGARRSGNVAARMACGVEGLSGAGRSPDGRLLGEEDAKESGDKGVGAHFHRLGTVAWAC